MKWIKKHLISLLLFVLLMTGAGLIAYPSFSDWWNSFHQSRAVASYAMAVADMDAEEYEKSLDAAHLYNTELARLDNPWEMDEVQDAEYHRQLNIEDTGIMGYIDIPKLSITLPIYHGIEERVLQVAIGHIPGSSLPVGGEGTHCVISGHRGLPSARLFTDIDKLIEGDTFTINVLNLTLTYEVDQIRTVEPTDFSYLGIEEGKDLMTLVTCTPYGINTHRLLVRGHRVANANGEANVIADALLIEPVYIAPLIAVPILLLLVIGVFFYTGFAARARRKNRKRMSEAEKHALS